MALRGEEVMQAIEFLESDIRKDSLLVTPVGICLSFYEQNNNFIFVTFNEQRVKLYESNRLTVVDAAIQADFPNDGLFPKRGKELQFTVNGKQRIVRGLPGEAATITVNGKEADIHTPIHSNDVICVKESTAGNAAVLELGQIAEYKENLAVLVNDKKILIPRFAIVNGQMQSKYYEIKDEDSIEFLDYCTVGQLAEFMDVMLTEDTYLYVNRMRADMNTRVYENFSVVWSREEQELSDLDQREELQQEDEKGVVEEEKESAREEKVADQTITVIVNDAPVVMSGKSSYVFVDVFDYIEFDLSRSRGRGIVTTLNKRPAQYMENIYNGDRIEIYWRE